MQKQTWLLTAGNKIHCRRCQAMSKRTRLQCGAPAMSGKNVCRFGTAWKLIDFDSAAEIGGAVGAKIEPGQSPAQQRLSLIIVA